MLSFGRVGERLKPEVLKIKSPIRYLSRNSTKSPLPSCKVATTSVLSELLGFRALCATFRDNLVPLDSLLTGAHVECRTVRAGGSFTSSQGDSFCGKSAV